MIAGDGLNGGDAETVEGVAVLCVDVLDDEQRSLWEFGPPEELFSLQ